MNKILIIIFVLFILIGSFWFFIKNSRTNITNYPSSGTEIIAFGDSLVEGVGASHGNDFVSILSERVGEPILNLGRGGDTTEAGLDRLDEVLDKNPKVVLLLLGGNDYIRRIPKEETFSNLGTIIGSIQDRGSIVILLGVRGGILKDNFESEYKKLSREYNTAYVPNVLDGIIGKPNLMSDTIHPNNEGYKLIADKIYPTLSKLLE